MAGTPRALVLVESLLGRDDIKVQRAYIGCIYTLGGVLLVASHGARWTRWLTRLSAGRVGDTGDGRELEKGYTCENRVSSKT